MRKLILALLLAVIVILPLTQTAQAKPGIVDGVIVIDQNGDPFLVNGSGNILQGNYTYGTHNGLNSVDYEAPLGMIVRAAFPGVIAKTGFDYAHGAYVIVNGDNGNSARYYHLTEQDLAELEPRIGEHVDLGAMLGRVGLTGNTLGNHYGLEIGYIDEHNPRNAYFSTVPEQRWYYNDIINKLIAGTFDEYRWIDQTNNNQQSGMESIK